MIIVARVGAVKYKVYPCLHSTWNSHVLCVANKRRVGERLVQIAGGFFLLFSQIRCSRACVFDKKCRKGIEGQDTAQSGIQGLI